MKHILIVIIIFSFGIIYFQQKLHKSELKLYKNKIDSLTIKLDSVDTELLMKTIDNGRYEYAWSQLDSSTKKKYNKLSE